MYQSKAGVITRWAEYLEKLHQFQVYKKPVNTITSHIKTELRKLGLEKAIPYVHEVLEFKFKNDYSTRQGRDLSERGNPRQDSSLNSEEENARYLILVQKT